MPLASLNNWSFEASRQAQSVDQVALFVLAICCAIAAGVFLTVVVFCIRYRQGSKVDRETPPENNLLLEGIWVAIPTLLGMAMFGLGARVYYDLYVPPRDALEIEVVGEQWLWTIRHPSGRKEINTLHIPLGQKVRLKMISQDVIHSFFLPEFRTKHDVLPGRYTYLGLEPTRIGRYELVCSEFCGTDHAEMRGEVIVMSALEYAQWSQQQAVTPADRGREIYRRLACAGCHEHQAGQPEAAGPVLDGIWGRTVAFEGGGTAVVDEEYLRRSILRPSEQIVAGFDRIMPTYQGQIREDELLDLVAFLRSRPDNDTNRVRSGAPEARR